MWAAELQLLSGRRHLAKGGAKDGLYQMIYGSFGFGRFGDPYRSTDGLLEAGGVLLDRREGRDWEAAYLTELCEVLENIRDRLPRSGGREAARDGVGVAMSATLETVTNACLVRALINGDAARCSPRSRSDTAGPRGENRDGETVIQIRRGVAGRRLVCAFTDLEALQAWDRNRRRRRSSLDAASVREAGRRRHGRAEPGGPRRARARGPAVVAVESDTSAPTRRRLAARRPRSSHPAAPARQPVPRAGASHRRGGRSRRRVRAAPARDQPCDELGDRLHGAAAAIELASWRAGRARPGSH